MTKATTKQLSYVRVLLAKAGRPGERYLGAWAKRYGLTMRERSGSIDGMDADTASKLIDGLKAQLGEEV